MLLRIPTSAQPSANDLPTFLSASTSPTPVSIPTTQRVSDASLEPLPSLPDACSVVVVGGGLAGMAAARTLLQHEQRTHRKDLNAVSVTLLEAKNRLGGRVHSVSLTTAAPPVDGDAEHPSSERDEQQVWADLGGMFWHGYSEVYRQLCQDFPHLESIPTGGDSQTPARDTATWLRYTWKESDDDGDATPRLTTTTTTTTTTTNPSLRPRPIAKHEIRRSQEVYHAWEEAMHRRYQGLSPPSALTESETSKLLASWSADFMENTLTTALDRELLRLRLTLSFEMDRGMPWENHTLASLDQDWDWIDLQGDDFIARKGMKSWVDALAEDIEQLGGAIQLNQRVEKIDYADGPLGCTIRTERGDILQADYVVVALPLGVLKSRAMSLFNPPLPSATLDALDRAGVGNLNTLLIRWDQTLHFSCQRSNAFYFLDSRHRDNPLRHGFCCPSHLRQPLEASAKSVSAEAPSLPESGKGSKSEQAYTVTQFHFSETGDHPFDDLEYWKAKAVEIVQDVVVAATETVHDDSSPPPILTVHNITAAHLSQWHADPDILGAYSSATTRTRGNEDRRRLGRPVGGHRVFFAGEHTHTGGRYQSMDGAYETGQRAAREILFWHGRDAANPSSVH